MYDEVDDKVNDLNWVYEDDLLMDNDDHDNKG